MRGVDDEVHFVAARAIRVSNRHLRRVWGCISAEDPEPVSRATSAKLERTLLAANDNSLVVGVPDLRIAGVTISEDF
ncbi:hypothetical protein GCM10017612_28780 [Novosphingobium resinovorum]|nr:hypothetical protein GCM10017612_28780 [Novosphingobium resinovorum]